MNGSRSDYEGILTKEIKALRKERGHDKDREWDIWSDGCEGGEYIYSKTPRSAGVRC